MQYYLINSTLVFIEIQLAVWLSSIYLTHSYISGLDIIAGIFWGIFASLLISGFFSLLNFIFNKLSSTTYRLLAMHLMFCIFLIVLTSKMSIDPVNYSYLQYEQGESVSAGIELNKVKTRSTFSNKIIDIEKTDYQNVRKYLRKNKIKYSEEKSWWGDRTIVTREYIGKYLDKKWVVNFKYQDGRHYTNDCIYIKIPREYFDSVYKKLVELYGKNNYVEFFGGHKIYCWVSKTIIAREPYYIVFAELNDNYPYGILTIGVGKSFLINKTQKI
jgi:hypothetical protein